MAAKKFEAWKKAAYEAWRTFWPAFIGYVALQLQTGAGEKDIALWARSVAVAGGVAGLRAVFKWAREKWGNKQYGSLIYKLPA